MDHHRPAFLCWYLHAGVSPHGAPKGVLSQKFTLDATAEVVHVSAERELLRRAKQPIPAAPPNTPAAGMALPEHRDGTPLRETVTSVTKEVPRHCTRPWEETAGPSKISSRLVLDVAECRAPYHCARPWDEAAWPAKIFSRSVLEHADCRAPRLELI